MYTFHESTHLQAATLATFTPGTVPPTSRLTVADTAHPPKGAAAGGIGYNGLACNPVYTAI